MLYIIITFFMMITINCSKDIFWKDDKLTIQRKNYTGNQLKTNGYYYTKYGNPEMLTIYMFYNNGIILHTGDGWEFSKLSEFEQMIQTSDFINKLKGIKYGWGAFIIEQNNIKFERWYPSEAPYSAYVREGVVINDTTFIISETYRNQKGKKTDAESVNETYHFKSFSHKPDSTNKFVVL